MTLNRATVTQNRFHAEMEEHQPHIALRNALHANTNGLEAVVGLGPQTDKLRLSVWHYDDDSVFLAAWKQEGTRDGVDVVAIDGTAFDSIAEALFIYIVLLRKEVPRGVDWLNDAGAPTRDWPKEFPIDRRIALDESIPVEVAAAKLVVSAIQHLPETSHA